MAKRQFEYDVCLSFAGEDRKYVEKVATCLRSYGVKVFYDDYEQTDLWGKDLYVHLDDVYRNKARYCVMFISKHYSRKLWTNHERKSAQAAAFQRHSEYLLPARFDATEIPGIAPTVGYISLKGLTPKKFSDIVRSKLEANPQKRAIPKPPTESRRIYYEGFDCGKMTPKELRKRFGNLWLLGKKGHWQGSVSMGVYRLSNLTKPDASLSNTIRYYEPAGRLVDLGDCQVSVRVRIHPPNDSHSGAGILFRAGERGTDYYAFFLHPGNSVSLAEMRSGKFSLACSQEIPENKPRSFVTLKIVGDGQRVSLFVNDNLVHTMTDAQIRSGSTGTIAWSIGRYFFDDFSIYLRTPQTP